MTDAGGIKVAAVDGKRLQPKEDMVEDLDTIRLSQDFREEIGVTKVLSRVPVRKPHRQEFVRVLDDAAYRMDVAILELRQERELYLLTQGVQVELSGEWFPTRLVTAINRHGLAFLWPLKLLGTNGQSNVWYETAIDAANLATQSWVKVVADMDLGGYQTLVAKANLSEPIWPDHSFQDLLKVAFRGRVVTQLDHPVIQELLGNE